MVATPENTRKNLPAKQSRFSLSLGALGISAIIHLCLFLMVGSVVIFDAPMVTQLFVSDAGMASSDLLEENPPPLIEETEPIPEMTTTETIDLSELNPDDFGSTMDVVVNSVPDTIVTPFSMPKNIGSPDTTKLNTVGMKGMPSDAAGKNIKSVLTAFGRTNVNKGLIGTFYDLRRDINGDLIDYSSDNLGRTYVEIVGSLINSRGELNPRKMDQYFRSPDTLSASFLLIPRAQNHAGPEAFGIDPVPGHQMWLVHYRGFLKPPKAGEYRFVGSGDEILIVRINGKLVLDATWRTGSINWSKGSPTGWEPDKNAPDPRQIRISGDESYFDGTYFGDWFNLDGNSFEIEVTIGEGFGGSFSSLLLLEEKSGEEAKLPLPLFKTDTYQDDLQQIQQKDLGTKSKLITLEGPTFLIPK